MSRSAAATTAGRQRSLPRSPALRHPRRVSGPGRLPAGLDPRALTASGAVAVPRPQRPPRLPARPPLRVVAGGAAIASRVAGVALDVSASRAMDRLVRSRAWIVVVAFGLIGIVAMQVSMLKLNAGIGRAVETADTLQRTNVSLRGELSRLSDGARIQSLAAARGFVMPAPADVAYLRAGDSRTDGVRAASRMVAADPAIAGPAGAATPPPIGQSPALAAPVQAVAAVTPGAPAATAGAPLTPPAAGAPVTPPAAGAPVTPPAAPATPAAGAPVTPPAAVAAPAAAAQAPAPAANAAGGAPATAPLAVGGP